MPTVAPVALTADDLAAAVVIRGFNNPVIQAWSRGAQVLYGYTASEAVGRVAHDLLASEYPVPLADIEEIVRINGEWLGAVRQQRRDRSWIIVLMSKRLRRDTLGFPDSIIQVAMPLALEREAGVARELVLSDNMEAGVARELVLSDNMEAGVARELVLSDNMEAGVARELILSGNIASLELRDVSHMAALEAAVHELDAFAYSVSHDLRTPLRAINGYAQALRDDYGAVLPPSAQSDLNRIQLAATRMGTLIDDMLRLSRITRTTLDRRPVDLADIARDIAGRTSAGEATRTDVRWEIDAHAWATADRGLLEIALENMLRNAWKFTSKHKAALISFSSADSTEGRVFTVRDDGVGFDMQHASKLFTPFHRLHSVREFEGTGIGLAIVQSIVRRHGGRAWAEAALGRGAAVHFTLPVPAEEAS